MAQGLNASPSAVRTQIGFFGRMNAGKSSLINALTGQTVSIVSSEAGTTTDVVRKPMELHGVGPCVLLDTAGFDDAGETGDLRRAATVRASESVDLAVLLLSDADDLAQESGWLRRFQDLQVPCLPVLSRTDTLSDLAIRERCDRAYAELGVRPLPVSAVTGEGVEALRKEIVERLKNRESGRQILGNLVREHDTVILVMPQDPQAPQGRLILPQAQTIREGLDRHCLIMCVQTGELRQALSLFRTPPALIVTDSQAFRQVEPLVPDGTKLTSFSVLFAALKGDMTAYLEGVRALGELTETSRVLIAECCTHAPLEEDIGRVKIPRLLRARAGQGLRVDVAAGADFPENIGAYDLIIQCGACMMNRRFVLSRIARARAAGVPITNYGLALAALQGILDRVETGVPGGA